MSIAQNGAVEHCSKTTATRHCRRTCNKITNVIKERSPVRTMFSSDERPDIVRTWSARLVGLS